MARYPPAGLLERVWGAPANVSVYDATYVALAEAPNCPLLTADRRLATVPGIACAVSVPQ